MITGIQQSWLDKVGSLRSSLEDGTRPYHWINYGFSFDTALEWRNIGAFNPERTKHLVDAGFSPDELGKDFEDCSIAYAYCNHDLSLEDVRLLAGK